VEKQKKLYLNLKMLNEYKVGDSKELLKEVKSNSVDLIYIDPPYCTGRDFYHFDDRFSSSANYRELLIRPLLQECHRVLTDIGNIVVHVEPKISHHIRIVLDDIFGEKRFKNEIVWISGGNHKSKKQLQRNHDTIIVYQKGVESIYNPEHKEYADDVVKKAKLCPYHSKKYVTTALVNRQPNVVQRPNLRYEWNGNFLQWHVSKERMQMLHDDNRLEYSKSTGIPRVKKYLEEMDGIPVKDVWSDIKQIQGNEKLDYATQKPVALLNRILKMFSNEDSIVLDPCAGSGTTGRSAIMTNRNYILFDINTDGKRLFEESIKNMQPISISNPLMDALI
jgi:DNA modification methylase